MKRVETISSFDRIKLLQEIILPQSKKPTIIFSGSHDLALEGVAEHIERYDTLLNMSVGSLDGLVNLRLCESQCGIQVRICGLILN